MGMADAAGDAAKAPNIAPNKDAATRPVLSFMMSSSAYAVLDIEVCSDQIVAGRKCNADEQIFSQSVAGRTLAQFELLTNAELALRCLAGHRRHP
jgi:hypothetical protein